MANRVLFRAGSLPNPTRLLCNLPRSEQMSSRWRSDELSAVQAQARSTSTSQTDRMGGSRSVTSFYYQSAVVDKMADKQSVRLSPHTMLYSGRSPDGSHILRSAQYLHKELPVRIAHRIDSFRYIPFIVGCNPTMNKVYDMYMRAFHLLSDFPPVDDAETEERYSLLLKQLLEDHREVVTMLAEAFKETRKYIKDDNMVQSFLDRTLTSRLGIRMLCEHHLALHEEKQHHVGVISTAFYPKTHIERKADVVTHMCESKYGYSPDVRVNGHINATFPYIAPPFEYVVHEVLKNSMRATVESHMNALENMPPVTVTIATNKNDFIIRISDRGGGIPHNEMNNIWKYGFTTSGKEEDTIMPDRGLFETLVENRAAGTMHGYGFGLPTCKAYVEYLGGKLTVESMQGIGTDVYIRLKHISGSKTSFRI